jgi:pSer/pThr/pTyr-binding forkhead associated (FHA) protein
MVNLYILNGPEIGRSFKLRDGVMFVGRFLDNDVRIDDKTVSCKHLGIVNSGGKFLATDLKSQNSTFYDGRYPAPGRETEIHIEADKWGLAKNSDLEGRTAFG